MRRSQPVEQWRSVILAADPDAKPMLLPWLCVQLAQQRGLISSSIPISCALAELCDRGFPIPPGWLVLPLSDALLKRLNCPTDAPVELLGQMAEALRSPQQKRHQGIFYTPIDIADYIVTQAIASDRPRVLDPACGGGMMLLRAYQHLLDRQQAIAFGDRIHLLQTCIHGMDIDAEAVAIAQISLLLKSVEGCANVPPVLPDLGHTLCSGNAVIQPDRDFLPPDRFDAVIGNPPYLDAEQMMLTCPDWRHYCTQHYRSARGNWDLFCVFIEQGLKLCRPGGITSMIVPNKLLCADYAAGARSLLMQENQLLALRDYSHLPIFAASVYPIVYVAQKQPPARSHPVRWEVMGDGGLQATHWLSNAHFAPDRPWLLVSASRQQTLQRLQALPTLESIAQVSGAATVAEAYQLQAFLAEADEAGEALRFVNSGTIDRYAIRWGEKPLRYLGETFQRPIVRLPIDSSLHKRLDQARAPKLIVAGMTRQLECAIDPDGHIWAGKSTSVVRSPLDLRYLLALLNSRIVDRYFCELFQGNRLQGGYLRIGSPQLRQIPIPRLSDRADRARQAELVAIVQQRIDTSDTKRDRIVSLETQIEQIVCELYHLTDGEIAAVQAP